MAAARRVNGLGAYSATKSHTRGPLRRERVRRTCAAISTGYAIAMSIDAMFLLRQLSMIDLYTRETRDSMLRAMAFHEETSRPRVLAPGQQAPTPAQLASAQQQLDMQVNAGMQLLFREMDRLRQAANPAARVPEGGTKAADMAAAAGGLHLAT